MKELNQHASSRHQDHLQDLHLEGGSELKMKKKKKKERKLSNRGLR